MVASSVASSSSAALMVAAAPLLLLFLTSSSTTSLAFPQSSVTKKLFSSNPKTSLNNILRDYADAPYNYDRDSGSQSTNWRKNQGYASSSTPRLFGGSYRDAETNPYYDPGWAQSTRRDNPAANFDSVSNYNGYDDPYNWRENRGYWQSSTFPGVGDSYKSNKVYTNPTNPYYDPIWSQSYGRRLDEPIREEDHRMYYEAGYDRDYFSMYPDYGYGGSSRSAGYYDYGMGSMGGGYEGGYRGGRGGYFGGYGRMNGPGRGLLAQNVIQQQSSSSSHSGRSQWMEARSPGYQKINGNSFLNMRNGRNFESNSLSRNNKLALRMSYPIYDEFDGPWMSPYPMGGPYMEGRWGPDMRRRGRGGPRRPGLMGGPSMGGPGSPGPFGRDNAFGRMSLKDMAARTTTSYDAEVISRMKKEIPGESVGKPRMGAGPTSTASQYVPLSSTYGPQAVDRSPPLNVPPPPLSPPPIIETRAMTMDTSTPATVQTARSVRPSVVLVTSTGVRNENSQGSGFVVEFDDSEDDVDELEVDRCYILTSAHVAPPGWKVSVTFPGDPDKQYPATVVGRKLNSDLALLSVESAVDDDDDEYPFPPPLTLSTEDISTGTTTVSSPITSAEIGSPLFAFGYPMGLEGPTMTSGILSATTKGINYMDAPTGEEPSEISKSRPFEKTSFVITDAAMAGGMSGGPLVNYDGEVLGVNALVRPDLRALGNYAVSSIECESFLEKLEAQVAADAKKSSGKATVVDTRGERRKKRKEAQKLEEMSSSSSNDGVIADGVAGYRVMLYGYSTSKTEATNILKRTAGLDGLRAENAMRSAYSFGAGVVDEFYVSESGDRARAERDARKKADDLLEKLKKEGMMVEVEPLTLLP